METDAIFRIYSMTKPITAVAALLLVDEEKLALDAPVSRYLPELEDLEVLDPGTRRGERLMLELRLNAGIPTERLEAWLALEGDDVRRRAIEQGYRQGLLEEREGCVRLTERGRLLADSLLCQLV